MCLGPVTAVPTKFDRLYADAAPALRAGRHGRERPPVEGGRWPLSVVLEPDAAAGERIDNLTQEVLAVSGPGHWATGVGARGTAAW